jgi:hypothetical protein
MITVRPRNQAVDPRILRRLAWGPWRGPAPIEIRGVGSLL